MNVRIRHTMNFTAGIYFGDEMQMNHYTLTLGMLTNSVDAVSHNIAFERIKYFVYNELDSTIFINQQNEDQCKLFETAGLSITTLPGEPVDQVVGLMLYYKLNAIMEGRILVNETELSSSLGDNIVYLHNETEQTDIDVVSDWCTSSDCVHSDYVLPEPDKIVPMHTNSVWRDLELLWPESLTATESGNIVVFADFQPNNEPK
jgi:hypothetical protein